MRILKKESQPINSDFSLGTVEHLKSAWMLFKSLFLDREGHEYASLSNKPSNYINIEKRESTEYQNTTAAMHAELYM